MPNLITTIRGAIKTWRNDKEQEKRGITLKDSLGNITSFEEWVSGKRGFGGEGTPLLESIFHRVAADFGKLDLNYIKITDKTHEVLEKTSLYEILTLRPNELMGKYDFLYTLAYQRIKYGNAIAIPIYDYSKSVKEIKSIEVIDCNEWMFGNAYTRSNGDLFLTLKSKSTDQEWLLNYKEIIHLRFNPNRVFHGDKADVLGRGNSIVKMFDDNINAMLDKLAAGGKLNAVIKVGSSTNGGLNATMLDSSKKIGKADEIMERINIGNGILILDATEDYHELNRTFETISKEDIESTTDFLYNFYGINKSVVKGTATEEEMEVYYSTILIPPIEQFMNELNYKLLTKTARTQGHRITHLRNPFEYVSLAKAADSIYKVSHVLTRNQILSFYNLPPVEGGDEVLDNLNFSRLNNRISNSNTLKGGDE